MKLLLLLFILLLLRPVRLACMHNLSFAIGAVPGFVIGIFAAELTNELGLPFWLAILHPLGFAFIFGSAIKQRLGDINK